MRKQPLTRKQKARRYRLREAGVVRVKPDRLTCEWLAKLNCENPEISRQKKSE